MCFLDLSRFTIVMLSECLQQPFQSKGMGLLYIYLRMALLRQCDRGVLLARLVRMYLCRWQNNQIEDICCEAVKIIYERIQVIYFSIIYLYLIIYYHPNYQQMKPIESKVHPPYHQLQIVSKGEVGGSAVRANGLAHAVVRSNGIKVSLHQNGSQQRFKANKETTIQGMNINGTPMYQTGTPIDQTGYQTGDHKVISLNQTHNLHEIPHSRPPIMASSRETIKIDRDRPSNQIKYYSSDHYAQQRPNFRKESKIIKYFQHGEVIDQYGLQPRQPAQLQRHMHEARPAAYSQTQSNSVNQNVVNQNVANQNVVNQNVVNQNTIQSHQNTIPSNQHPHPPPAQNRVTLPRIMNPGEVRVMQQVKRSSRIDYGVNAKDARQARSQTPPAIRQNASAPHQQTPYPSKMQIGEERHQNTVHPAQYPPQDDRIKSHSNSSQMKQQSNMGRPQSNLDQQNDRQHQQYSDRQHHYQLQPQVQPQVHQQQYSAMHPPVNIYPTSVMHPRSHLNGHQLRPISRHPSHISSPSSLGLALGSQNHHIQIQDIDLSSSPKESLHLKYNHSLHQSHEDQPRQQQYQSHDRQQSHDRHQSHNRQQYHNRPPSNNYHINNKPQPPEQEYFKIGKKNTTHIDAFNKMLIHSNLLIDQIYENQTHKALYRLMKSLHQPKRRRK